MHALRSRTLLLPVAALLLGAGCRSTPDDKDPTWLIRHGQFDRAVRVAREDAEAQPGDARLQRVLRDAELARMLDRGRQAVFAGETESALELFERAFDLDPESTVAANWILKTRYQLADEWLDRAHDLANGTGSLADAQDAYERVLRYVPDHPEAQLGLGRVLQLMNYREGLSLSYYNEGLRDFRELFLLPSQRNFSISKDYDPEYEAPAERLERVREQIAEERLDQAKELEEQGFYFAARNEYRLVLLIRPDMEEAQEGFDRMDFETRATGKFAKADMDIRRGDLDLGKENLADASRLTLVQGEQVEAMQEEIEEARLRKLYDRAVGLERDYRYYDSLAAYDELLSQAEFYEDAIARRNTVQWLIDSAEEAYARAVEAPTDDEAYALLQQVLITWPEYKDVEARMGAIEARRKTQAAQKPD